MIEILLATNNKHKIKEYRAILTNYPIRLFSLTDLNITDDPVEDGDSYKENALIKAREISKYSNMIILADDSGIEIEPLGKNFPGIYSKRYADKLGGFDKCNNYLVKTIPNSRASFHCTIALLNLESNPLIFEGVINGRIAHEVPNNKNGFGYDPIFKPDDLNVTYDEISNEEKNKISHRKRAVDNMIEYLKSHKYI